MSQHTASLLGLPLGQPLPGHLDEGQELLVGGRPLRVASGRQVGGSEKLDDRHDGALAGDAVVDPQAGARVPGTELVVPGGDVTALAGQRPHGEIGLLGDSALVVQSREARQVRASRCLTVEAELRLVGNGTLVAEGLLVLPGHAVRARQQILVARP